jgi:hypothetical protein
MTVIPSLNADNARCAFGSILLIMNTPWLG